MRNSLVVFSLAFVLAAPLAHGQDIPETTVIGSVTSYKTVKGDTLASIARAHHVGLVELLSANSGITSDVISVDQPLTIPGQHLLPEAPRTGIVINLAGMRIFRFSPDGAVATYPVSVGKEGWDTPTGQTKIVTKRKDPTWTVPDSIRAQNPKLPKVVPSGPDNPLGQYALTLGWPGYLIHGTNTPWSIGKPSSHGCIRLFPEDIEALFNAVKVDDAVTVVDAPFTLGRSNGVLYLEATPTRQQAKDIAGFTAATPLADNAPEIVALKKRLDALQKQGVVIDRNAVSQTLSRHDGIPVAIGKITSGDFAAKGRTTQKGSSVWSNFWEGIGRLWHRLMQWIGLG